MTSGSKLALITALATEQAALARNSAAESQVILIRCGMGAARAGQGLQTALAEGVDSVVLMGFAAGLCDEAPPGRVVVPRQILYGQETLSVDADWQRQICDSLASMSPATDPLLCVDAPLLDRDAKAQCASKAIACDMESAAIVAMAQAHGIPAAVVRIVLDGPKDIVPPLAVAMVDDDGSGRWPGWSQCLHPIQWWQLLQLIPRFRLACSRLQAAGQQIVGDYGSNPA